ncbi:BolA family transcriptional regulator [Vibrio cincinnatiensis]|uniref:Acid stress-induced BolA-like protein IbaG/YrbA, predicted regulator of iron metabolism n=1 Tax=Vibrio cincinnatiensis DSM 19608 TaxID=1123491 RepID=A0A1T4QT83_VIBCI|nr:BolA family iron metabolism protein IbaG [Vibrio cincinnatiensis]MCG3722257.1 BolA family transcriptional regulator [Vibrio cincinnatiensis]MCG3725114.1 BolA family transcriptional regulator [Vibrio cincinnatiensis]MCG3732158.1 BolA family transcriptional regulator [Vibrio cincinnatiensis]MCG3735847.1 BolA family transcriptional regulator [Vibrio cincinnatiensis]MCG3739580.1 BolA family transcriptional regulator [Vibrio cincinnatiensis]
MDSAQVQQILEQALNLQELHVKGEGSHYEVIAIDESFENMSRVKKQQMIYAPLMEYIQRNDIHAVSIKTFTPQEWARNKKLMSL